MIPLIPQECFGLKVAAKQVGSSHPARNVAEAVEMIHMNVAMLLSMMLGIETELNND